MTSWAKPTGANAPQWVYDLTLTAHDAGEIRPDDWRYAFIMEALNLLADFEDADEAYDSLCGDTYTAELTAWLASSVRRTDYADEGMKGYDGEFNTFSGLLSYAQYLEKAEVFNAVRSFLEDLDDDA